MQAQPRQCFKLLTRPRHPDGHKALRRLQHRIGIGLRAHAPQQRLRLESRAAAVGARRVAAVLGQQHADVHLVGLALQVLEEARDAIPLLAPVAFLVVGRAVDHPGFLFRRELVPRRVARDAGGFGVAHQVVLGFFPRRRLDWLDGAGAQRQALVGNHQPPIDADHAPKAAAGVARADRRVEREHRRNRVAVAPVAFGAMQAGGELPQHRRGHRLQSQITLWRLSIKRGQLLIWERIDHHAASAALERDLDRLDHAGTLGAADAKAVGHHVQSLFTLALALGLHAREAAGGQPLLNFFCRRAGGQFNGEGHDQARIVRLQRTPLHLRINAVGVVVPHRQRGVCIEQLPRARKQQLQVVVQLRHRADGGARRAHRIGLVDGNRRRHAFDLVHGGLVHAVEKLPRVGAEGFDVAALAFGKQRVEHQARLARAAGPGDHGQLAGANVEVEVLEVVLAGTANADQGRRHAKGPRTGDGAKILCAWRGQRGGP